MGRGLSQLSDEELEDMSWEFGGTDRNLELKGIRKFKHNRESEANGRDGRFTPRKPKRKK
jgi:hypothetical protein